MRKVGGPFCQLITNAPLASMLAKASILRSSILICPLPRTPGNQHPATRARHPARNAIVIFFMRNRILLFRCGGGSVWIQKNQEKAISKSPHGGPSFGKPTAGELEIAAPFSFHNL